MSHFGNDWPTRAFRRVMHDVLTERGKQESKWGEQNHDPFAYLTILGEEYGEACQAALHAHFDDEDIHDLREELVQVAAVAVAFVECLDRGKWKDPDSP